MTKDQLDAIQKNIDFNDVSIHDVIPLLAECKRLREENTVLLEANEGEPWAWQVLTKQRDAAYKRGAEAMREAAAIRIDGEGINGVTSPYFGNIIRALPIPEDNNGK